MTCRFKKGDLAAWQGQGVTHRVRYVWDPSWAFACIEEISEGHGSPRGFERVEGDAPTCLWCAISEDP